jgi:hypothetical protein
MSSDAAKSSEAATHPPATPLPFDPVGKTRYTAEEIHALFEGAAPPGDDNNRTVLAAHPDRPATPEELAAFVEELWALHRAEAGNGG